MRSSRSCCRRPAEGVSGLLGSLAGRGDELRRRLRTLRALHNEKRKAKHKQPPPQSAQYASPLILPRGHRSSDVFSPSSEWQDMLTAQLNVRAVQRNTVIEGETFGEMADGGKEAPAPASYPVSDDESPQSRGSISLHASAPEGTLSTSGAGVAPLPGTTSRPEDDQQSRRQRRRVDDGANPASHAGSPAATSVSGRSQSPHYSCPPLHPALLNKRSEASLRASKSMSPITGDGEAHEESGDESQSGEDELAIAVGQLSINEDEQVRYHGKASGLHLLGISERDDGRSEGGIWYVKCPHDESLVVPPSDQTNAGGSLKRESGRLCRRLRGHRPRRKMTGYLVFPLRKTKTISWSSTSPMFTLSCQSCIRKPSWTSIATGQSLAWFLFVTRMKLTFTSRNVAGAGLTANSPMSDASSPSGSQASVARPQRIPTLLLLAMFSVAARYSSSGAPPPEPGQMWTAGDSYMEDAKAILDSTYAQSRPSTCQALLLLGYREVGIGAMAQAWLYIGMAVRMAQDLGLHKSADKWSNVGRTLFTPVELQERRRIWYGCVIMDKYISTYIGKSPHSWSCVFTGSNRSYPGRPVAISENDFDTELPSIEEVSGHLIVEISILTPFSLSRMSWSHGSLTRPPSSSTTLPRSILP